MGIATAALMEAELASLELLQSSYRRVNLSLSHEDVIDVLIGWLDLVSFAAQADFGDGVSSKLEAYRGARCLAKALHCRFHTAFSSTGLSQTDDIEEELGALEARYDSWLQRSHLASLAGDHWAIGKLLFDVAADGADAIDDLCTGVAGLLESERGRALVGLRVSVLARRATMLTAALVMLFWRTLIGSQRAGLVRVAEGRSRLRRYEPALAGSRATLEDVEDLTRLTFSALVTDTGWIERPRVPYSFATTKAGVEIRVHRRDLQGIGVAPGRWVWVRGKAESEAGKRLVVAEFEGPGQHARTYWEDWLADEVRPAYDLYPKVIDMAWEYPQLGGRSDIADLVSRVASPIEADAA